MPALSMSDASHIPPAPPDPAELDEHWDSYLALVDDAAASLLVNMYFVEHGPLPGVGYLHHWALPMRWPGEHGMGTEQEADGFGAVEEQVTSALQAVGLYPVGRLRTAGYWQVSYYGERDFGEELEAVMREVMGEAVAERVHAETTLDERWEYFIEFLCPDLQQLQWMADRDVVMRLLEHGDSLAPRPVEHTTYFASEEHCRAFAAQTADEGFDCAIVLPDDSEVRWTVKATREDGVALEEIHPIADGFRRAAADFEGDYDGWGTELLLHEPAGNDEPKN
jgi:hypothetical protein